MNKVNPKKLLPAPVSKKQASLSQKMLVPASKVTTKDYARVDDSTPTPQQKELNQQTIKLKTKFISLTKLFGEKTSLEKKKNKQKRIEAEQEKRQKREEETESSNTKFNFGSKLPKLNLPRTGFLDTIKRFLLYGLLGFAIDKFGPMVPALMGMITKLAPAFEFFKDVTSGIIGGIVNFIDTSYKAYDFVKGKVQEIIGPDKSEDLDNFTKGLKGVINGTLIVAGAILGLVGGKGLLGKRGVDRGKVEGLTGAAVGVGLGAAARKLRFSQLLKARKLAIRARETKIEKMAALSQFIKDKREYARRDRAYRNKQARERRESRRTPEEIKAANRARRKQELRDIIKSTERNASPQAFLKKAAASQELARMYNADANIAALRRGSAIQRGQRSRLMTVGETAIPYSGFYGPQRFFPKSMMPFGATKKLKKYKMPFEEAVLSKPYGYNPDIVKFSSEFPTGYVEFRYGGKTKRMSQDSARYLNTLIENAVAGERIGLGAFDRQIANEFFNNPKRYQSQVRAFVGQDIDAMSRVVNRPRKKPLTKEDLARPRKKPLDVSPTAARTPRKLRGFAGGLRGLSKGPLKALIGPFIGGIVDFVVSLLFGDPIGEAAAGAVGAAILGAVGGFLGNLILPIGGGFIGATLGGFGGDYLFREMYKKLFNVRQGKELESDSDSSLSPTRTAPARAIMPSERQLGKLGFTPVVTGRYGDMRKTGMHGGTDIAAPSGTPLVPVTDGKIVDYGDVRLSGAKRGNPGGWGSFIVYTDANGYYHLYGHLSEIVKKSGKVRRGEVIAKVGNTGRSTDPHLHWEVGTGWTGGVLVGRRDPLSLYPVAAPFGMFNKEANLGNKKVNAANGLNDTAGYEDEPVTAFVQPVVERVQTPAPASGGGTIVLNSNNTPSIFAPALVG